MNASANGTLSALLVAILGESEARELMETVAVHPPLAAEDGAEASRAVIAEALALLLFADLLDRVPAGRDYVARIRDTGGQVVFDHGALRTVAGPETGALPAGDAAFSRILAPLGYEVAAVYPLARINMTGRAYRHQDYPEDVPQYFVSELHPERFSPAFQDACDRVLASSRDPLTEEAKALLDRLADTASLEVEDAKALLPVLAACFGRQHDTPALADYETLLAESAEMAWIATEGNAFNHATDRVPDVMALNDAERAAGRPIKETVEVSSTGRVRQTAYRAATVKRDFVAADGSTLTREVPGSFYEFITRDPLPGGSALDLGFDAANAQGIFKMTSARQD